MTSNIQTKMPEQILNQSRELKWMRVSLHSFAVMNEISFLKSVATSRFNMRLKHAFYNQVRLTKCLFSAKEALQLLDRPFLIQKCTAVHF